MEINFHSHANKTHFHKKGCAPSLILISESFWNSEVAGYFIEFLVSLLSGSVFMGTSRYEAKVGCFQIVMFNDYGKPNGAKFKNPNLITFKDKDHIQRSHSHSGHEN